ncbi:hypothetical protein BaRGS_00000249 [Batillaria attramentaria]|uniref:ARID domain-containing protein n=1 Tax=Batillaria attramentaria TaxID=370345 RepID=A0ABD0MD91_9CAEN
MSRPWLACGENIRAGFSLCVGAVCGRSGLEGRKTPATLSQVRLVTVERCKGLKAFRNRGHSGYGAAYYKGQLWATSRLENHLYSSTACPCWLAQCVRDELLAVSEKLIITAQDLCQLVVNDVEWCHGRYLHCYHDLSANELTKGKADVSADLCQAFAANNRGVDKTELHAPVVIMSYPQYCRYRAVLKRLETVTDKWLKNALVMAIGGFASTHRGMRVMFCREVCDYPELDDLEFRMDHLAPNLKGRPRKKKLLSKKDSNQDSDSNGYGSDQSSNTTTSSISTTPKVKSQRLVNKNGLSSAKRETTEEEREFLVNLHKFMDKRNSPIDRLPSLGFKQIDLYLFYKAGQQLGGYDEITDKRLWKVLYDNLGGNPGNTSAATNTRRHYERLILPYEKHLKRLRVRQKGQPASGKGLPPPATSAIQNGQIKSKVNRKGKPVKKEEKDEDELQTPMETGVEPVKLHGAVERGQDSEGRKVMKVEDLYDVQAVELKSLARQRAATAPLEVPVQSQLSSSHHRQQQHPSPAHSGSSRSSIPQHLKAAHDFSSPSALAFQSPDLCPPLPSEPPPAHSSRAKRPNTFSQPPPQPEAAFPHPDQVLSRIQTLHQSSYPPEPKRQRLNSPATSVPSTSSSTGGLDEPLDLSVKPGASAALVQGHGQEQQDMSKQSDVLLQSALFGAQFTALPRPSKPAELSPSMVPLVHPAFMQAAFSPLSMYSAQLSPTALQLAAYEELVRQKALSNMAATSSPSFMMSQLPGAYSQPTKETQK